MIREPGEESLEGSVPRLDPLSMAARLAFAALNWLTLIPMFPVTIASTTSLGCLVSLTMGLALIPLQIPWIVFLGVLLGTSKLWELAPPLRPVLLPLVVVWAFLAYIYVSLVPDTGEKDAKWAKLSLCDHWPHTWALMRWTVWSGRSEAEFDALQRRP